MKHGNMMCAGYDDGELDARQGGPIHLEGKDRKIDLIGIVFILPLFFKIFSPFWRRAPWFHSRLSLPGVVC